MKTELQVLLEALPPDSRPIVEDLWTKLPADVRHEMEITLGGFSKLLRQNPASFLDLVKLVQRQAGPIVASSNSKVAVVGPVNVGKSTLYNALVSKPEDRAKASPVPGTTRTNQTASLGLFELVDTPGADNGASVGEEEKQTAFAAARQADFLLVVFDASGSVTASDKELYAELKALGKPHLIVLNKMDLLKSSDRRLVQEAAANVLGVAPEVVIPVSAANSDGIDRLVLEITASEPNLLARVGEHMPFLRRKLSWQAIRRAAVASAVVALTPIPVFDLVPLALIQGSLVLTVSRIYGEELGFRRALELIGSLGMGWLARTLFQELSKLGGLPGWVISACIACSATIAIGYTALTWFETGTQPTPEEVEGFAKKAQGKIFGIFARMGKKPSKKGLTQELESQLPEMFDDEEVPATKE